MDEQERRRSYLDTELVWKQIEELPKECPFDERERYLGRLYACVREHAIQWPYDYDGNMRMWRGFYAQAMLD